MRNLSSTFKRLLYYNDRNYDCTATITLVNNTELTFTNSELWSNGFDMDDAVSEDNNFTALGSVIIGSASIIINNMDDQYSEYDFTNAEVVLSVSKSYTLDNTDVIEPIRMGTYKVDDASYNGSTISLSLLDYMEQFDRPYRQSELTYPATLDQIVRDACLECGVTLNTYTFPHRDYVVSTRPDDEAITFREVIGWAATIAGCFARCDVYGRLELKWFDTATLESYDADGLDGGRFDTSTPYSTGNNANGGSFNPWNTGTEADGGLFTETKPLHYLNNLFSQTIGVDNIVITGVRIVNEEEIEETVPTSENDGEDEETNTTTHTRLGYVEYLFGTDGYVIEVKDNPLITKETVNSVGTWLAAQLIGLTFRNMDITHLNDPSIEAGDIAIVTDRKGNEYPILVTRTSFSADRLQTTVCGAESALKNSATRYTDITKSYVASRKLLNREQTTREQALQRLSEALDAKAGLYATIDDTAQSGSIFYLHDKPLLEDSSIVWKMTAEAWGVSTDGGETWNAGMTVDGDVIARILNAIGVNASWINTGELVIYDVDSTTTPETRSEVFYASADTGVVRMNGSKIIMSVTEGTTESLNDKLDTAGSTATSYIHVTQNGIVVCKNASSPNVGPNLSLESTSLKLRNGSNKLTELSNNSLIFYFAPITSSSSSIKALEITSESIKMYANDGETVLLNLDTSTGLKFRDANGRIKMHLSSSQLNFYENYDPEEDDESELSPVARIGTSGFEVISGKIGDINIASTKLYSGSRSSVSSNSNGFYFDKDGQVSIGNDTNYIKFVRTSSQPNNLGEYTYELQLKLDKLTVKGTNALGQDEYRDINADAEKTATNYLYWDSTNGLIISEDGTSNGTTNNPFNTQILSGSINLRNRARTRLSVDSTSIKFYRGNTDKLGLEITENVIAMYRRSNNADVAVMELTESELIFRKKSNGNTVATIGATGLNVSEGVIGGFSVNSSRMTTAQYQDDENIYATFYLRPPASATTKFLEIARETNPEVADPKRKEFYITASGNVVCSGLKVGEYRHRSGTTGTWYTESAKLYLPQDLLSRGYINVGSIDSTGTRTKLNHVNSGTGNPLVIDFDDFTSDSPWGTIKYTTSSSKRYKNHIRNMSTEYARALLNITPVIFKFKDGYLTEGDELEGKEIPGFYAEDVEEHFPMGVYHQRGKVENWNATRVIPPMLKLIQDMDEQLQEKDKKIKELEARLEKIEQKLDNIVNNML